MVEREYHFSVDENALDAITTHLFLELGNAEGKLLVAAKAPSCITKRLTISEVPSENAKSASLINIWNMYEIYYNLQSQGITKEKFKKWDRIASGPKRGHVPTGAEREHWKCTDYLKQWH